MYVSKTRVEGICERRYKDLYFKCSEFGLFRRRVRAPSGRRSSEAELTFRGHLRTCRSRNFAAGTPPLFLVRAAIVLILIIFDAQSSAERPFSRAPRAKPADARHHNTLTRPCAIIQPRARLPLRDRSLLLKANELVGSFVPRWCPVIAVEVVKVG